MIIRNKLLLDLCYRLIFQFDTQLLNMKASMAKESEEGPELPRIRCAFHTDELLTNFCSCSDCLLPLCPSCIKIHVNEHINLKTNPQIQNINDLLRTLYKQLQSYGLKFNFLHKQFVEIQNFVEQFRQRLKNKIYSMKNDMISAVEDHFKRIELDSMKKISELKYVKNLLKFKEYTKKAILSLKNTERNFFSEQSKVMRMIIKYQANDIRSQLDKFCRDSESFFQLRNDHFFTFNIRDNFVQLAIDNLHNLLKIDIHQSTAYPEPHDITVSLKELYEKYPEKKEIKRSIYKFLSHKDTPGKYLNSQSYDHSNSNIAIADDPIGDFAEMISSKQAMSISQARPTIQQMNENELNFVNPSSKGLQENYTYSSVKESIVKATQDLNFTLNRNAKVGRIDQQDDINNHRRRSLSKGKGITLMQSNTAVIDFKKGRANSILRCDMDLAFINERTQPIPRYR